MIDLASTRGWLILALALLAAALIFRRLENYVPSRRGRDTLRRWVIPALDLAAGASAAGWTLEELVGSRSGTTGFAFIALFLVLIWIGRSVLGDFVAGVFVRMEGTIEPGRRISVAGVEGKVTKLGYRSVAVEGDEGSTYRLPWKTIATEPVRLGDAGASTRSHSFTVVVPRSRPIEGILQDIPASALVSPWASATIMPEVRLQSETEEGYVLRVTVHALDARFAPQVEAAIRERLSVGA